MKVAEFQALDSDKIVICRSCRGCRRRHPGKHGKACRCPNPTELCDELWKQIEAKMIPAARIGDRIERKDPDTGAALGSVTFERSMIALPGE